MSKVPTPRDITPVLQKIRDFCIGRTWNRDGQLRRAEDMSPRPGPQPNLPSGPAAKLSANYYYTRDARRESKPPLVLLTAQKQIGSGVEKAKLQTSNSSPHPGKPYHWTENKDA
ncbi:NADH dehydrogenase [ubiquinone] 1 alpha subcomplex subunit 7 [Halotydeus destructor]|nr:NADH dehydrogenase [ubiquinone] 1 alpha subcomplex subunit 7 [Halotydeus destructor]